MFKVKSLKNGRIYQVLDTYLDSTLHLTYFLVWDNDGWRWRLARNYVPPNYVKGE